MPQSDTLVELLNDKDRQRYAELIARLKTAKPEEIEAIASEIFEMGHAYGYEQS